MAAKHEECSWCGSSVDVAPAAPHSTHLCAECDAIYEAEAGLSLHPAEERCPYAE